MRRFAEREHAVENGPGEAHQKRIVREIFSTITGKYDFLNHLLSLRRDVAWRRTAASRMRFFQTHRLLDVATGTCDLIVESLRKHGRIKVVGLDLVPEMMEAGREKLARFGMEDGVRLMLGDALHLPFSDGSFDNVSIAFGIRNIRARVGALREMLRVLVPGGKVLVLEMALPEARLIRPFYRFYLNVVLPKMAGAVFPNPEAYHYLAESITGFPTPLEFARMMREAGFERVEIAPLTWGITYLHTGHKPAAMGHRGEA